MTSTVGTTPSPYADQGSDTPITQTLAAIVREKFEDAKSRRILYEEEWLKDLRQYKGIYERDVFEGADEHRSRAFIRLTRTKVKAMDSRLHDMMFPAGGDKNWAITPVPVSPQDEEMVSKVAASTVSQMAAAAKQQLAQAAQTDQANAANGQPPVNGAPAAPAAAPAAPPQQPDPNAPVPAPGGAPAAAAQPQPPQTALGRVKAMLQAQMPWLFGGPVAMAAEVDEVADQTLKAINDEEKDRCLRMSKVIESQLDVARYADKCRAAMHSGNLYGTGILKGPLVEVRNDGKWAKSAAGTGFEYKSQQKTAPFLEFVPIWDIYPDLNPLAVEECEYIIQRHVMMRSDLRALAKRDDFQGQVITNYIANTPDGDVETLWYEAQIRQINGKETDVKTRGKRYEVLEYWGYVDGRTLAANGVDVPEEELDQEFEANVWTLGGFVIKAVLNPFDAGVRPYHFYYFEKDDTSVFGIGIANIMRDTQQVFNACIRATIDNAAMSAGPMFEVNRSLLVDGEDIDEIIPFRVFERKGDGANPAVRVMQVPNTTQGLMALAQAVKQFGDEATTIPAYTQGEPATGMAKTVGGLSMLMGASNITMKDTVKNFDSGVTEPAIRGIYHWNMQFNSDDTIKGNYDISARGASSLVAKEVRAQQLETLSAQTLNPEDAALINRRALLLERIRNLDLPAQDLVYTEEQVQQNLANAAKNQPPNVGLLKYSLDEKALMLKSLIEHGELQLKERKQALDEQISAFDQKMTEHAAAMNAFTAQVQMRDNA